MRKQTTVLTVLFISLILIVLLSFASFAAPTEYIIDETGRLFEDEIDSLNEIAEKYYDQYNVALYYAYVLTDFDDLMFPQSFPWMIMFFFLKMILHGMLLQTEALKKKSVMMKNPGSGMLIANMILTTTQ